MTNETQTTNTIKPTKPRHGFRFRLRTLLIMLAVLSIALCWVGWELDQRRREKATIAWVEEMGGFVFFYSGNRIFSRMISDERSWWEKAKDKWFGEKVLQVYLVNAQVSDLSPLAELKDLARLHLADTQVSDLSPLAELKNLERLDLRSTEVTDLSPLAKLKNLEHLGLIDTQVNEEQVEELRLALPNCEIDF